MRFTSISAVVVVLLAFGSTSVLAHGKSTQSPPSHDPVTALRRYFEENGYTTREIMDEYKLFRRTRSSGHGSGGKGSALLKVVDHVMGHTDSIVKLAGAASTIRGSGSSSSNAGVYTDDS